MITVDLVSCVVDDSLCAVGRSLGYSSLTSSLPFIVGMDSRVVRETVEKKRNCVLLDPHRSASRYLLHQRDSGLNQVLCRFAARHGIIIAFSLPYLRTAYDIGAVMQNISLCRKYHVPVALVSCADSALGLRSVRDMQAFGRVLGMSSQEAVLCVSVLAPFV